jgi:hypothetical protein
MTIAVWLMFAAGVLLQIASQANASLASASNSLSGWNGWLVWLKSHAIPIVVRAVFEFAVFGLIVKNKDALGTLFGYPIPVNLGTAVFFGFTADSALDKVGAVLPWFKVEIPKIAPPSEPTPRA